MRGVAGGKLGVGMGFWGGGQGRPRQAAGWGTSTRVWGEDSAVSVADLSLLVEGCEPRDACEGFLDLARTKRTTYIL